jgi:copper ion binding protein
MKKVLSIKGMSCNHCVNHVKSALEELDEVILADVNLADEKAVVEFKSEIEDKKLIELIDEEGYELVGIEKQ